MIKEKVRESLETTIRTLYLLYHHLVKLPIQETYYKLKSIPYTYRMNDILEIERLDKNNYNDVLKNNSYAK